MTTKSISFNPVVFNKSSNKLFVKDILFALSGELIRKGILSELVIFADKLFANVAGPTGDADTLFSILSIPGEIMQNKGGWRDSSF